MLAVHLKDFETYGCPNCGCDSAKASGFAAYGETAVTCRHCLFEFVIRAPGADGHSNGYNTNRFDNNGERIFEQARILSPHPRQGILSWKYELPDLRPNVLDGEYWEPRGVGYDLSGFVKSRQAGQRLHKMVCEVLAKDKPESWLDYRSDEPYWIQYKLSASEFDLEKIYNKTKKKGIITRNILISCKKEQP